ncbi:hypothetical protein SDC9_99197 [bioreactor metagenome]|jgi:hypothetical protein|uniref:Uncharacterized protein n=1 Tax=bioreactor metagenome TaxID=1076179 RepID=A0A645AI94_9ZZZZ
MNGIEEKEIETGKSIQDILYEVVSLDNMDPSYNDNIKKVSDDLRNYYDNKGRHLYSEVSTFLYKINEEDLDYVYNNIESVHKALIIYDEEHKTKYGKKILKLEDHIRLEILRAQHLNNVQNDNAGRLIRKINSLSKKSNDYTKKFNGLNKQYESQRKSIEGLNSEIISVIGIFSAIVITFFGGINFIESVLNSINKVSKYRLVFAILITGFVMFNTIFMLLNFISKLTGKNIRSSCDNYIDENKCAPNCKNRKNIKCIKLKHPTIYWVNAVFIAGIIGITLMYYLDYFNIPTKILN